MSKNRCRILNPSDDIPCMEPGVRWGDSSVNYESHPAYSAQIKYRKTDLAVLYKFLKSFVAVLVKRLIRYESIPLETRTAGGVGGKVAFIKQALASRLNYKPFTKSQLPSSLSGAYSSFQKNGILAFELSAESKKKLQDSSSKSFTFLEERRKKNGGKRDFEESRSYKLRREEPELFAVIEDLLLESGAIDIASSYKGRQLKLIDVNPQINDTSDDFWKRVFPDLGSEVPAAAYYHRDASGGDVKVIFYMNDVTAENGSFCYTLGSNQMSLSRVDDYICEANDSNGFAGTSEHARKMFSTLPKPLRQKGAFGNDLTNQDALYADVLRSEWKVEAPAGSMVMFDTKGIHRGGLVENGERRVITCVLG